MQILTHAQNGNAARHESNVRNELDGEGGRASKGRESRNIIENRKTTPKTQDQKFVGVAAWHQPIGPAIIDTVRD
jgi:hypothetical protein